MTKRLRTLAVGVALATAAGGVAAAGVAAPGLGHGSPHPKPTMVKDEERHKPDQKDHGGPTGLTGLDNALAHVTANLKAHPNKGLANAQSHLAANRDRHASKDPSKDQDEPAEG